MKGYSTFSGTGASPSYAVLYHIHNSFLFFPWGGRCLIPLQVIQSGYSKPWWQDWLVLWETILRLTATLLPTTVHKVLTISTKICLLPNTKKKKPGDQDMRKIVTRDFTKYPSVTVCRWKAFFYIYVWCTVQKNGTSRQLSI